MLGRPPNVPRRERKPAHIDLDDIQGNVLRGYTLPAAAYLFLRIVDVEAAWRLMIRMLPHVMTAETWSERPGSAMNVAFTYAGLERLGLPETILASFPPVFREGMAARAAHLGDRGPSAPSEWEPGLGTGDAHVLVTVYAADLVQLRAAVADVIEEDLEQQAVSLVHLQQAEALPGGRDHFGFFDGIAQPAVEGAGVSARPGDGQPDGAGGWRELATGEVVLGYVDEDGTLPAAPLAPFDRNGTFVVYRKLHMDPAAFRRFIRDAGYPDGPDALAAKIVGRWPDGTPLSVSPAAPDAAVSGDPLRINDFGYADDPHGLRCPHGAHVRRTNPRDSIGFFDGRLSNRHRIVRRGRAYGPTLPAGRADRRRRRPRPDLRLLPGRHLAPVRDHPGALDRRRRPVRPRRRQGLPRRRAPRNLRKDDHPGPPAVLLEAAAALRHDARRRVPLPAVDDGPAAACGGFLGRRRWRSVHGAYDVFLSYSSPDRATVQAVAQALLDARLSVWFDRWNLTAGRAWEDELADGIKAAGACAVCVGPGDLGDWSREEYRVALVRGASDPVFRVFLVLLPGLPEPFDPGRLSPFLTTRTWVDLRGGLIDLQPLVNAIRGLPSAGPRPTSDTLGPAPYRGLRPFEEADADDFFGRDAETQRAIERLKAGRFLAVVGASGSGKSSLARAGIIPALRGGALPGSAGWSVRVMKPGAAPLTSLATQLAAAGGSDDVAGPLQRLREGGADALHLLALRMLVDRPDEDRLLLVVDQFEEVFTRCRDEEERRRFVEQLVFAATAADGRLVTVLTLRADFYPRCAAYPELAQLVSARQALIGPMAVDALREAIVEPARAAGAEFEPGLVELLVSEVEGRPGALPLLEHALLELWARPSGRVLTLAGYQDTGGVAGAVAQRAEQVFTDLAPDEQQIARRVLLRLTEPGDGTEDTRRRAALDELARTPSEAEAVMRVVGALTNARLLTADDGVVDVAHEALIRGWPRLRRWLDEDRAGLRIHRRVSEAALEWDASHDAGLLFRGARLAEALAWRERSDDELNARERAFLDASAELVEAEHARELRQAQELAAAQGRAKRRLVWAAVVLLLGVVAASLATLDARRKGDEARVQRGVAERQADTATARLLLAEARESYDEHLDDALLEILTAIHLDPGNVDTHDALAEALSVEPRLTAILRPSGPDVLALTAAPDGQTALSVDATGAVTRWDLAGTRPPTIAMRAGALAAAAFSGDGRRLATIDQRKRLGVWDASSHALVAPYAELDATASTVTLDHDGRHLFVNSVTAPGLVWTVGRRLRPLPWPVGSDEYNPVLGLAPDGEHIAKYNQPSGTIEVRDLRTRRVVARADSDSVNAGYTADGQLWSAEDERSVVFDAAGRMVRTLPFPYVLGANHDGSIVAGTDLDGRHARLSRAGHAPDRAFRGIAPGETVFVGDDRFLTSADGRIALWQVQAAPALATVRAPDITTWSGDVRTDGREVLFGDGLGPPPVIGREVNVPESEQPRRRGPSALRVVDPVDGTVKREVRLKGADIGARPVLSPDGRLAAAVAPDDEETVLVWDLQHGDDAPTRVQIGTWVTALAFAPHGRTLALGTTERSVLLVDLTRAPGSPRTIYESKQQALTSGQVDWLRFAGDGRSVFASASGHFFQVNVDGTLRRELPDSGGADPAISADERVVATVDGEYQVRLSNLATGRAETVTTLSEAVHRLSLTADGTRLAVSDGAAITVWDTRSRRRVATLDAGEDVNFMGWSGSRLLASAGDRFLTWDLGLAALRTRACRLVNRNLTRAQWRATAGNRPYARLCPGIG